MLFESGVSSEPSPIVSHLHNRIRQAGLGNAPLGAAPFVTLSYAQSLDGSIAAERGKPMQLSNVQTQALTHRLRAAHDAILVGINTVLSDDPRLTVRLVSGKSPKPVVLDSRLRFPLEARLLRPPCLPPIIATRYDACAERERRLREAGAQIVRLPFQRNGLVDLGALLTRLHELGIHSLLVEGGGRVITNFLDSAVVDQLIVTIVPKIIGGVPAVNPASGNWRTLERGGLSNVSYYAYDDDLVVCADLEKSAAHSDTPPESRVGAAR